MTNEPITYSDYTFLNVQRRDDGVVEILIDNPAKLNACDPNGHDEFGRIWLDIDRDPLAKVSLITGAGKAFCAGGDLSKGESSDPNEILATMRRDGAIVHNMTRSRKPIVSAINGVAVGAGLAVALLADISIAGDRARIIDGHTKLGVVAGDHAALVWPLMVGLARSKYYLLLCEEMSGAEAAEAGLVSRCVPQDELLDTARDIALRLANGSQWAIQGTKAVLNQWLNSNMAVFDHSLWMEATSFFLPDAPEGVKAFTEKRAPQFPSAQVG
jgi:enoyl-CoA hydratase